MPPALTVPAAAEAVGAAVVELWKRGVAEARETGIGMAVPFPRVPVRPAAPSVHEVVTVELSALAAAEVSGVAEVQVVSAVASTELSEGNTMPDAAEPEGRTPVAPSERV